jgi:hypothetical protein
MKLLQHRRPPARLRISFSAFRPPEWRAGLSTESAEGGRSALVPTFQVEGAGLASLIHAAAEEAGLVIEPATLEVADGQVHRVAQRFVLIAAG